MKSYKVLNNQVYSLNIYSIVPIRIEDRFDIMKWRNEQLYHLRQNELLTIENQDNYFDKVVLNLFDQEKPDQILFSFLENDICIGYGGLVKINWIDENAEISFLINTDLEAKNFEKYWNIYLELIENVAFREINLHKIFVYAFDLRPYLYNVLEKNKYFLDARLKDHCQFKNKFIDVIIYSKIKE